MAKSFKPPLLDFFKRINFLDGSEKLEWEIEIPEDFSFCDNYDKSLAVIRNLVWTMANGVGQTIRISFEKCIKADQQALFVMQILKLEYEDSIGKIDSKMKLLNGKMKIEIVQSEKSEKVNALLLVTRLVLTTNLSNQGLLPFSAMGYIKGNKHQKHYAENKKGVIGTKIVAYVNECLEQHGYTFNADYINYMDGLISEILNNAEDHSPNSTYYATANFLKERHNDDDKVVGEINLSFMNFGDSIYEGFQKTSALNNEVFDQMVELSHRVMSSNSRLNFTQENLFTLYALQEGVSRLKFEEESRGTGTMKFITSFMAFGDFEDDDRDYHPTLTIISGSTVLTCDNKYKPFKVDNVNYLSLNAENDLTKAPDRNNLKTLSYCFPGTLINAKIYLNKDHLTKKLLRDGAIGN